MKFGNYVTPILIFIFSTSVPSFAQDGFGPVKVKDLKRKQRAVITEALRPIQDELMSNGLTSVGDLFVQASKSDCPDNCNDEYIGGNCYCGPDKETGECPEGTEENDDVNPTPGRECQTLPESFTASGGGLTEPVIVTRP